MLDASLRIVLPSRRTRMCPAVSSMHAFDLTSVFYSLGLLAKLQGVRCLYDYSSGNAMNLNWHDSLRSQCHQHAGRLHFALHFNFQGGQDRGCIKEHRFNFEGSFTNLEFHNSRSEEKHHITPWKNLWNSDLKNLERRWLLRALTYMLLKKYVRNNLQYATALQIKKKSSAALLEP